MFMKKLMTLILATLCMVVSSHALDLDAGSIVLKDGRRIVKIDVGDDREDHAMDRIRRLEQAVADLQQKVYDLQAEALKPKSHDKFICTIDAGDTPFVGKAETAQEAMATVVKNCKDSNGRFCDKFFAHCDQLSE